MILLVATSIKVLELTFYKHIDMYWWIYFGSLLFEGKMIVSNLNYEKGDYLFENNQMELTHPPYNIPKNMI